MQLTVLVVTLLFMAIIAAFFIVAVRSSKAPQSAYNIDGFRSRLIWGMLAFGTIVSIASLWSWPHAVRDTSNSVTVNATGFQWYWEIDKTEVPVGKPVVFNVHTGDVTHGLGIVDPSGRLLIQTQAMPGYVNQFEHVFDATGPHKVICLEFCGIAHHKMLAELNVVSGEVQQ